ncbi:MAG: twin-arginine translocase subunit TatB [Gammaproteobacteria bacterium]|nr:twin-arginine translocase subunit TatB [Gammaproteobacteria bacterium]
MFDIGFWELCLIAVVALLILGPERLPMAARTAGLWIGKARRMIGNVKSEIDRELQLDEVRKKLQEEESKLKESTGLGDLEDLSENTISDVSAFEKDMQMRDETVDEDYEEAFTTSESTSEIEAEPNSNTNEDSITESDQSQDPTPDLATNNSDDKPIKS